MQAAAEAAGGPPLPTSIESLFREHHGRVYRAAYRVTGNPMDAEDVLQTVFLRLMRRDEFPDLAPNPGGYLYRAAVNAALDVVRARAARRPVSLDDVNGLADASAASPAESQQQRELAERLRQALGRLSARAAQMFVLRYFEGHDLREVARLLGTSRGSVAVTLFRARNRLKKELGTGRIPSPGETP